MLGGPLQQHQQLPPLQLACSLCGAFNYGGEVAPHSVSQCPMAHNKTQLVACLQKINESLSACPLHSLVLGSEFVQRLLIRKALIELFLHENACFLAFDGFDICEFRISNHHNTGSQQQQQPNVSKYPAVSQVVSSPVLPVARSAFPTAGSMYRNFVNGAPIDDVVKPVSDFTPPPAQLSANLPGQLQQQDSLKSRLRTADRDPTLLPGRRDMAAMGDDYAAVDDDDDGLADLLGSCIDGSGNNFFMPSTATDRLFMTDALDDAAGGGSDYEKFIDALKSKKAFTLDGDDDDCIIDINVPEPAEEYLDSKISEEELNALCEDAAVDSDPLRFLFEYTGETGQKRLLSEEMLGRLRQQMDSNFQIVIQNLLISREIGPSIGGVDTLNHWKDALVYPYILT